MVRGATVNHNGGVGLGGSIESAAIPGIADIAAAHHIGGVILGARKTHHANAGKAVAMAIDRVEGLVVGHRVGIGGTLPSI